MILVATDVGFATRAGISFGWDCVKKLLLVFVKVEENIFNGEFVSRIGWGTIPNGSTWKVELVADE